MEYLTIIRDFLFSLTTYIIPEQFVGMGFAETALLGLFLLAPCCAAAGVQVIHLRLVFFTDAVSHSAFAGAALGLVIGVAPELTMPVLAMAMGVAITYLSRRGDLSNETLVGVCFSAIVALGLAIVGAHPETARTAQTFLFGSVIAMNDSDLLQLSGLACLGILMQIFTFNRLLFTGLDSQFASLHGVKIGVYQYIFALYLALTTIISARIVGVLLVTALIIVPAASARKLAKRAASLLWWSLFVSLSSALLGFYTSLYWDLPTGAAVVLAACLWFILASGINYLRQRAG